MRTSYVATLILLALTACSQLTTPTPTASQLTAPHEDGVYLVGVHIAAGKWVSSEQGDGLCYWVRRKYDGIILKSYLGSDGAEIVIQPGDYEVEFAGCGIWIYAGEN